MSDNKKYYYLKLKDNFFDNDAMIVMESMQDGYKYSNILLKLYLRSLKDEGKLMFNNRIPYNSKILAQVTRHSVGDVEKAIEVFKELDLIEVLDNGAIYITDIQNFIGTSSTEADRVREYRRRIEEEREDTTLLEQGSKDICTNVQEDSYKCTPELEIELEIERELEIDKDIVEQSSQSDKSDDIPFKEIIDYLNKKADRKFRHTTEKTRSLIKARWNEDFSLEDFKAVIDIKVAEWDKDSEMSKFLRPETLFGTKFEGYLNQPADNKERDWESWDFMD